MSRWYAMLTLRGQPKWSTRPALTPPILFTGCSKPGRADAEQHSIMSLRASILVCPTWIEFLEWGLQDAYGATGLTDKVVTRMALT